jgi:hypothetical protein
LASHCAILTRGLDCPYILDRREAVSFLSSEIDVVAAGRCANNSPTLQTLFNSTLIFSVSDEFHFDRKTSEKYLFFRKFYFGLVPENSACVGGCYLSEKILECVLSGTLPIYFGCLHHQIQIFNVNRIISIKTSKELLSVRSILASNQTLMKEMIRRPILAANYKEKIRNLEKNITIAFLNALRRHSFTILESVSPSSQQESPSHIINFFLVVIVLMIAG